MHTHSASALPTPAASAGLTPPDLIIPRDALHDACLSLKDLRLEGHWYRVGRDGSVQVWVRALPVGERHHLRLLADSSPMAARVRAASGWFEQKRRPAPASAIEQAAAAYEAEVNTLARDIESIVARQESVKDDDLLTLGWSLPKLAELLPEALKRVRSRAVRHLDPVQ